MRSMRSALTARSRPPYQGAIPGTRAAPRRAVAGLPRRAATRGSCTRAPCGQRRRQPLGGPGAGARARTSRSRAARASAGTAPRRRRGSASCRRARRASRPCACERSSSTYCAKRDRLATTRTRLVAVLAHERQDARVVGAQELDRAAPERGEALAQRDEALRPPEQRRRVLLLVLDVERLVVVLGVDDDRQDRAAAGWRARSRRCGRCSTASACARRCGRRGRRCRPCRSRRRSRGRASRAARRAARSAARSCAGCCPTSGASRRRMPRLIRIAGSVGVGAVHVVALLVGHHLQRQLVVVAQEQRPLAAVGERPASARGCRRSGSGPPCGWP